MNHPFQLVSEQSVNMKAYIFGIATMVLSAIMPLSFAKDEVNTLEQEIMSLYSSCEMAGGSHVWDMFYELSDDILCRLETIYTHNIRKYKNTHDWKFKEPLIQTCYDSVQDLCTNMELDKKEFANQMIYAMQDKLEGYFWNKLHYSPGIEVDNLDLHLKGNERSIRIEQNPVSRRVKVTYERDAQIPEKPERIVRIDSLYGYAPRGFKPYFMLPKDPEVVSCYVQQTGDHTFLWNIQNIFHCCVYTMVGYKNGSHKDYTFWRDGQEMETGSDKLLEHQDATKFIKVYFSVPAP